MKSIVVYYSRGGNNKFLAQKLGKSLQCEVVPIEPRITTFFLLLLRLSLGIKKINRNFASFDRIYLVGPIWMGTLVKPLHDFIKKYQSKINSLVFVTSCGSNYKMKEEKFGHGIVFQKVKALLGEKCIHCEAIPISLILPEDQRENSDLVMKSKLSETTFGGDFEKVYNAFIEKMIPLS
jgi:flavodoxin